MAVPKRKKSRSRTRSRKAVWLKTNAPTVVSCKRCRSAVRPHTVCGVCGYYADQKVIEVAE
jgi:large subunit ribosomal protein L32